ncbi:MAG: phosphoribosylglycinamide formyltransferase [Candidatus Pelagadaptatus aseana]|uniref:phosphoribosylglycinamide formyltransferase n=1 Tax=Candidatus Pelagadaptatus aseana TaxID=3120508 RepID=UPI0039B2437D
MTKVVVLISGSGSNLQAIIDACKSGQINAEIAAVISNRPNAYGLERAENAGIPALLINHKEFESREAFDTQLQNTIDGFAPDLVVLAGFMRILTEGFTEHYLGRMLNIHPSLLPKYPGLNTHQRALDAGDGEHGATVHFVTPVLDDGPNVIHASIDIEQTDSAATLATKVHVVEHFIYPKAVEWFAAGRLTMNGNQALLDNTPLPQAGMAWADL